MRAVIYARVSYDRTGEHLAVTRQLDECRAIAAARGWQVVAEFVDNSISASDRTAVRPQYDAMRAAHVRGEFDALLCWDLDRLTRQPRQLEDWIDAAERQGLALITANGEADLTTDGGRMYARIKAAVARAEVERKGARQRASNRQRVAQGRPPAGDNPVGYLPAMSGIDPVTGPLVAEAFRLRAAGWTLTRICEHLNEAGLRSRYGGDVTPGWLQAIFRNPRYKGRLTYKGEDVGPGAWEPLVDEVTWQAAQPKPGKPHRRNSTLLSSIARCGVCGGIVYKHKAYYQCGGRSEDGSIRHVARQITVVDAVVTQAVLARLEQPDALSALDATSGQTSRALAEIARVQARLDELADAYAAEQISMAEWQRARRPLEQRRDRANALVAGATATTFPALHGSPEAWWAALSLQQQRELITALVSVTIMPAQKSGATRMGLRGCYDPRLVVVEYL